MKKPLFQITEAGLRHVLCLCREVDHLQKALDMPADKREKLEVDTGYTTVSVPWSLVQADLQRRLDKATEEITAFGIEILPPVRIGRG